MTDGTGESINACCCGGIKLSLAIFNSSLVLCDRRTSRANSNYRLNHAVVVKLYHLILNLSVTIAYLIGESRLFRCIVTFLSIAPYKYFYLLTYGYKNSKIYAVQIFGQRKCSSSELYIAKVAILRTAGMAFSVSILVAEWIKGL